MLQNAAQNAPVLTGLILLLILIGFVVAVGAAMAMVGRSGWRLLVSLQRTQKTVLTPAVELAERAEKAAERADALAVRAQELDGTLARLHKNIAALTVLTETIQKASQPWLGVRSFLRK
jgi:hypothetical protein